MSFIIAFILILTGDMLFFTLFSLFGLGFFYFTIEALLDLDLL